MVPPRQSRPPFEKRVAYRVPIVPPPPARPVGAWTKFFGGLFGGFAMSGIYLSIAWFLPEQYKISLALLAICAKIGVALGCLLAPAGRPAGAGVVLSIGINTLLFGWDIAYTIYTCRW